MDTIRLYNSKTRAKEPLIPLDPENVRMYLCGPTVYDRAHLGNARNVILFDVLFRLLRHQYGPDHVTYVRNFTDVDDKINAEALRRQKAGATGTLEELIAERTEETIGWYHADMDALGALRPSHEPRATDFIPQMITMIETLIARGHAYARDGHVLFRVRSYADYGQLSGRTVDDMIAGARVEVAPFKEDPMDFVLWKPSSDDEPGWDGPKVDGTSIGRGRPGWHIECSAMADELLMKDLPEDRKSFDIHGGGLDLQFPHHENELAQSTCAHPEGGFANIWLHNEMLLVEGKKMSKSLGNFFTVRDLLDQGVPGEVIRLVFLQTHYRKPMDWTEEKRVEANGHILRWRRLRNLLISDPERIFTGSEPDPVVLDALADDLNTNAALTRIYTLAMEVEGKSRVKDNEGAVQFFETLAMLGFPLERNDTNLDKSLKRGITIVMDEIPAVQARLSDLYQLAKTTKDYSEVDRLKAALVAAGLKVQMSKNGVQLDPTGAFDPDKFQAIK